MRFSLKKQSGDNKLTGVGSHKPQMLAPIAGEDIQRIVVDVK